MAKKRKKPAETWRYVLIADRELAPEQQSTFILRPLTQLERGDAQDNMVRIHAQADGSRTTVPRNHRLSVDLCLSNIHAIENCPPGAPEAWPDGHDERLAYLEGLDYDDLQEIGNEIWVHGAMGDDAKNS